MIFSLFTETPVSILGGSSFVCPLHPPPSPPYVGFVGLYITPPDFPQPSEARKAFWWKPLEANLKENMRWALCRQFPRLGSQLKQPVKLKNGKCGKRMRTSSSCARAKLMENWNDHRVNETQQ